VDHQTILMDLDDTLIYCNKYFHLVIDQFADLLDAWFSGSGFAPADFKAKQSELDLIGVRRHGFIAERFPESLVETYRHFSAMTGRPVSRNEMKELRNLGFSVYEYQAEPYPGMEETLERLRRDGHSLYLYTGGDERIQRDKIRKARLEAYFGDRIFITRHKTEESMERLLAERRFDRARTWMVGNSVTTDIVPALKAGIHSIYLPAEKEWSYNTGSVDLVPKGAYFRLASLREVPGAIRSYLEDRMKARPTRPSG